MREARFALVGIAIIATGFSAVVIDGADHLRVATAVAAVISLLASAFRPRTEESDSWTRYLCAVTFLGALIVLIFFVLLSFVRFERPKQGARSKPCPTGTPTPPKKPKMEGKK